MGPSLATMVGTWQQYKETLLIGTVYIALPTADVYSDGAFIMKLALGTIHHPACDWEEIHWNSVWNDWSKEWSTNETCLARIPKEEVLTERHPVWTSMMILPFLANYIMTWFLWYQIDHRKRLTWLACLLNLYPQARAAGIIFEVWRNPKRGLAKKKKFEREVAGMEADCQRQPKSSEGAEGGGWQQLSHSLSDYLPHLHLLCKSGHGQGSEGWPLQGAQRGRSPQWFSHNTLLSYISCLSLYPVQQDHASYYISLIREK